MSELSEQGIVKYIFIWHSQLDACPKCRSLNNRVYQNQDIYQPTLVDPLLGPIWDLNANRSLMHGGVGTCRCFLEVAAEVDLTQASWWRDLNESTERLM